jgi:hypothetical protein
MKNFALVNTNTQTIKFSRVAQVTCNNSLEFFVVPTSYKSLIWLITNKIVGHKLTNPAYNKTYKTLTGTMEE